MSRVRVLYELKAFSPRIAKETRHVVHYARSADDVDVSEKGITAHKPRFDRNVSRSVAITGRDVFGRIKGVESWSRAFQGEHEVQRTFEERRSVVTGIRQTHEKVIRDGEVVFDQWIIRLGKLAIPSGTVDKLGRRK